MQKLTANQEFYCEFPEGTNPMPIDEIKNILSQNSARGIGPSKPSFAQRVIKEGFDIDSIRNHPNLQSVKYFVNKLENIGA